MDANLEKKLNQLRALKQYKDKTDEELLEVLKKRAEKRQKRKAEKLAQKVERIDWVGLSEEEEPKADLLFKRYKENNHIEGFSDIRDLKNLIVLEIIQERYQKRIQELIGANKNPPKYMLDTLHDNLNQIMTLKDKLGLNTAKEEEWIDFWGKLKKKLQKHIEENRGAFTMKCPHCGNFTLLTRKVEDYNTFPFKCFKGTVLYNEELFKLIDKGVLSKEQVANVFGCSVDYIDRIYEKVYLIERQSGTSE